MLFAKRTFLCARRVPLRHVSIRARHVAAPPRRASQAFGTRARVRARALVLMVDGAGGHPSPSPPRVDLRDGRLRSDRMDARRDASPRRFSPATLYVGGLNFATDEATLRDVCAAHGEVDSAKIIYDHDTGRSRGFAFVAFVREADARRAAHRLDGRNVDGRRVRCNLADERRRGGDVAGASDRREFVANDRHETRDAKASASERHKRRRRSDAHEDEDQDEEDEEDEEDEDAASPRVAALESLLAKTRREAVAQRERADAAEAALAKAVRGTRSAFRESEEGDGGAAAALRAALRLTARALAELETAAPAARFEKL